MPPILEATLKELQERVEAHKRMREREQREAEEEERELKQRELHGDFRHCTKFERDKMEDTKRTKAWFTRALCDSEVFHLKIMAKCGLDSQIDSSEYKQKRTYVERVAFCERFMREIALCDEAYRNLHSTSGTYFDQKTLAVKLGLDADTDIAQVKSAQKAAQIRRELMSREGYKGICPHCKEPVGIWNLTRYKDRTDRYWHEACTVANTAKNKLFAANAASAAKRQKASQEPVEPAEPVGFERPTQTLEAQPAPLYVRPHELVVFPGSSAAKGAAGAGAADTGAAGARAPPRRAP